MKTTLEKKESNLVSVLFREIQIVLQY